MKCCRVKSSVFWWAWCTACVCAVFLSCLFVMRAGWITNVSHTWDLSAGETQQRIVQSINGSLNFLKFASASVPYIEPDIGNMPASGYDPSALIRMYQAYNGESDYSFGSFGFMERHPNSTTEKLSWQIANYPTLCPYRVYCFSDLSVYPLFVCHCVLANGTVDYSSRPYNGTDYGFKPDEEAILDGRMNETFLPIFDLVGTFTLTHELGILGHEAIAFAEMSLGLFTAFVESLDILEGLGVAYVAESATGAMLASTDPRAVFGPAGARLFAFNSSDPGVSSTFWSAVSSFAQRLPNGSIALSGSASGSLTVDEAASGWRLSAYRYVDQGLDWVVVVAVPSSAIFSDMTMAVETAAIICMVIALAVIAASGFAAYQMHRSALRLAGLIGGRDEPGTFFSDNDPVEYHILNKAPAQQ